MHKISAKLHCSKVITINCRLQPTSLSKQLSFDSFQGSLARQRLIPQRQSADPKAISLMPAIVAS